jgi:hypothetical protein
MSGGSKRTYANAFETPPSTPQKKTNDVVKKVFNSKQRVQQLIMNYKNNGRLNENTLKQMWNGSVHLKRMYNSLTNKEKNEVIKNIKNKVEKL